jgi:aminoglycoside phosphotransferase (APT) family kinase protein
VNYCDFLRHTLAQTRRFFSDVTVITCAQDRATITLAQDIGAKLWISERWFEKAAAFNKSAALNEWLASLSTGWTLILDADTYLPDTFRLDLAQLDSSCLYSIPRRLCENEWDWVGPIDRRPEYQLAIPPVKNGKVWRRPTTNPAALSGYFHLWNRATTSRHFYPDCPTAAEYDVEFALQFPEHKRTYLPGDVVHLGPVRQNWSGRVSAPWALTPEDPTLIPEYLKSRGAAQIYQFKIGSRNPTFLCTSRSDAWVYRTVPPGFAWQVCKETYIQQSLKLVPAPKVISVSDTFYIMEYGGLTAEGIRTLPPSFFASCGELLRRLHEETLDITKLYQVRYAKAAWDSMFGYHLRVSQCARWLQRVPPESPLLPCLKSLLARMQGDAQIQDVFRASRFCFTHGDYKTANILTDGTQAINLIDFEHAIYGDPDSDLHCFCQRMQDEGHSVESFRAFLGAYGISDTFLPKQKFYRYFRAFQHSILTPPKAHDNTLVEWLQAIHDGADPYLQCSLA